MIDPLKTLIAAAVILVSPVANPDNPAERRAIALASVESLIARLDDSGTASKEAMEVLAQCREGGTLYGEPFCSGAKIKLLRLDASMQKAFQACGHPALQNDHAVNAKCDELAEQWQPYREIIDQI